MSRDLYTEADHRPRHNICRRRYSDDYDAEVEAWVGRANELERQKRERAAGAIEQEVIGEMIAELREGRKA